MKDSYLVRELKEQISTTEFNAKAKNSRFLLATPDNPEILEQVSLALVRLLSKMHYELAVFKVGPYQDLVSELELAAQAPVYNLDSYLHDEKKLRYLIAHYSTGQKLSVLVSSLPYFDSLSPWRLPRDFADRDLKRVPEASAAELARLAKVPVILVLDARTTYLSTLAAWRGYLDFRENESIAGLILYGMPDEQFSQYQQEIEVELGVPVLANIPAKLARADLETKEHLAPQAYKQEFLALIDQWASIVQENLKLTQLLEIADLAPPLEVDLPNSLFQAQRILGSLSSFTVAVARDEAFSELYRENLELLEEMGGEIVFFSPLAEQVLPSNCDAIYFPSGPVDKYIAELSRQKSLNEQIKDKAKQGLPILAEANAAAFLAESFNSEREVSWPMLGILPSVARENSDEQWDAYAKMTARKDDLVSTRGQQIPCLWNNKFVFEPAGASYRVSARARGQFMGGFSTETIWASSARLHFYAQPLVAAHFALKANRQQNLRTGHINVTNWD